MNGAQLKRLLENPGLFPDTLNTATSYERTQDDRDGDFMKGRLALTIAIPTGAQSFQLAGGLGAAAARAFGHETRCSYWPRRCGSMKPKAHRSRS